MQRFQLVFCWFSLLLITASTCPFGKEWRDGACRECVSGTYKLVPFNITCRINYRQALVDWEVYLNIRVRLAIRKLNRKFESALIQFFRRISS